MEEQSLKPDEERLTPDQELRIIEKLLNVIDISAVELRVLLEARGMREKCDVIKKMTRDVRSRLGISDES